MNVGLLKQLLVVAIKRSTDLNYDLSRRLADKYVNELKREAQKIEDDEKSKKTKLKLEQVRLLEEEKLRQLRNEKNRKS